MLSYNGEECGNYEIGNPKTYRGKDCTWANVHRLASFGNVSFAYDYAGIRIAKAYNGVITKYGINGSTIVSQENSTVKDGETTTNRITFFQGFDGVTGFQLKTTKTQKGEDGKDVVLSTVENNYNYKKNTFGDVIGIYNEDDQPVVKYAYDAWGNCKIIPVGDTLGILQSIAIGNLNPYRYRSYYFDVETGLYYLQSRYYDPQVGRFISMDQVEYLAPDVINGLNLYAYCLNNPVMGYDPDGTWLKWLDAIVKVVAVVAVVATAVAVVATGGAALAVVGLSAATGGLVGGIANEKEGGSFTAGYIGGVVNGTIQSVSGNVFGPVGTVYGGTWGSYFGTGIMQSLDNVWGVKKRTPEEIKDNMLKAAKASFVMSCFTVGIGGMFDVGFSNNTIIGGTIDVPGSTLSSAETELFKGFFSAIDDAIAYIFGN